jgi:hypothetical protein
LYLIAGEEGIHMRFKTLLVLTLFLLVLLPSSALAQQETGGSAPEDDVLIRINGPLELAAGESAGTVVAISEDATIAGNVMEALVVIDGSATLSGTVNGDVVVVSGDINLLESARIEGDLNLYDSDLTRAPGSIVSGSTHERSAVTWSTRDSLAVSAFLWAAMAIFSVVVALLFAAVGGRQLVTSAEFITRRTGATILATVVGGILIPIFAVLAILTIFGIPVGLALLLLLMPLMAGLGYVVAGTRIGLWLVERGRDPATIEHPYLAAVLGVVVLHAVGLIPSLGGMIQFIAAVVGAGALTLLAWNAWRARGVVQRQPTIAMREEPSPAS